MTQSFLESLCLFTLRNDFNPGKWLWSQTAFHYSDVIMSMIASQTSGVSIVCSTVGFSADQRKHQSSGSLVFVWGIHRWPVNSPHKGPVTRKMFPFDDVIMWSWILVLTVRDFGRCHCPWTQQWWDWWRHPSAVRWLIWAGPGERHTARTGGKMVGLTHWPLGDIVPCEIWMEFYICNFQIDFSDWWFRHPLRNCPYMNITGLHWWITQHWFG